MYSRHLRATPYAGTQKQWADKRAWWFIVLTRGCVRLPIMPIDWTQTGHGVAEFIDDLPGMLRDMFGDAMSPPRCIASDRGPGLYQASSGTIVAAYREALQRNGFHPFAGEEAKWQPPDIPDVLLHETVAAWVRAFFRRHPFQAEAESTAELCIVHTEATEVRAPYQCQLRCGGFVPFFR